MLSMITTYKVHVSLAATLEIRLTVIGFPAPIRAPSSLERGALLVVLVAVVGVRVARKNRVIPLWEAGQSEECRACLALIQLDATNTFFRRYLFVTCDTIVAKLSMARSKKKQTQLAFQPLSPDSPASQTQPVATRSRAAAVAISPSQKGRINSKITDSLLPTPTDSSQPPVERVLPADPMPPSKRKKTSFMTRSSVPRSSPLPPSTSKSNVNGDVINMFDDSESDDAPVLSASTPKQRRAPTALPDESEEDNAVHSSRSKPTRKKRSNPETDFINDDDDEELSQSASEPDRPQPKRRRLIGPKTPRKTDSGEVEDLKEDLDFLKSDEPDDGPGRYVSSQHSAKRQGKLSALEQLKKNRSKQSHPSGRGRSHVIEEDEDEEPSVLSDVGDPSNSDSDDLEIIDNPSTLVDVNDESFIVEDDEEAAEIPLEMRMNLMKDKELFEFAVEWMCQKRLNPAFAYDDEVYATAFRRLDDSMKGLVGSKFQSSAWTAAFTRAIKARPDLQEEHFINDGLHDKCDACNRSRHPPTWRLWLQGDPYNQHTLEDESEDEANRNRETKIPSASTTWYLGRFCMANAKSTHTLAHWRYHLYQWVNEYLDDGMFDPY